MMTSVLVQPSTYGRAAVLISERFWLVLIFAVGASLRLYGLGSQSLWQDEGLQYYVATHNSITELFGQSRSFHPPLSFIINHLFLLVGDSDLLLRLPSALFGIASLPLLYILARELTSSWPALFSVFVLALSPTHIWYNQEARMYSQLMFFSLLSSVLLIQALKRERVDWWIYYIISSAAGMYTHVFMGLALAGQFVWMLIYQRRQLLPFLASGLVAGILFLPWALFLPWVKSFAHNVSAHGLAIGLASDGRARFSWEAVAYTVFVYGAGFSLGPSVAQLHSDKSFGLILSFLPSITITTTVFLSLLGLGIIATHKRFEGRPTAFCLLGLVVPLVGTALYSFTPWGAFNVRYTIVALPYCCFFVGTALNSVTRVNKFIGLAAMLAVMSISSVSIYNYFNNPRYAKEDIKSAVTFWRKTGNRDPLITSGSPYPTIRYFTLGAEPLDYALRCTDDYCMTQLNGDPEARRLFWVGLSSNDIRYRIEQIFLNQNASSAYLVLARDWDQAREGAVRNAFAITYEGTYPGVKIFKISRPSVLNVPQP